ncbi:MAG: DUF3795 domain-containing protein [Anaerolineales bacterium]
MSFRYDTYCGLYCGACPVLLAGQRGELEALAAAWGREPEDLRCEGCKSHVLSLFCAKCDLKACAVGHGIEFCYECEDYPCTRLVAFSRDRYPHHHVVLHNLGALAEEGLERWLEDQATRWRCPTCQRRFAWYSERCEVCGSRLYDARAEDRDLHQGERA